MLYDLERIYSIHVTDFLCIIETYNSSRQVEGLDLSEVNFITEPYANPALRQVKFKQIYIKRRNRNEI